VIVELKGTVGTDDDQDEDTERDEFEGTVSAATNTSITLGSGIALSITNDTVIEADGDITSLAGVIDALSNGRTVRAEGALSGSTATSVKFEIDQ
jgi:hypothetical protein